MDSPPDWPTRTFRTAGYPPPKYAVLGFSCVDDGNEFEVCLAEGDDPVGGTPARVTAALYRSETMMLFQLPRSDGQVGHRNEHMIDFHSSKVRTAAKSARAADRHF